MQIRGHGVSVELQEAHMKLQKRFFDLPQHVKERIALSGTNPVRGYFGKGVEDLDQVLGKQVDAANGQKLAQQVRKDNKEGLDMNGASWSKPRGGYVAEIFGMPSQLLDGEDEVPDMREIMAQYASEMFRVSQQLLSIMALVLGKPRDFFEQHLTNPVATHRMLHYPPMVDLEREIGVGAHTDYGLLTVLKQDLVGGLQVLNAKDGEWVHCPPVENAFVVNLGDMMGRWTAHRFKSTVHRVINTKGVDRYSVPYFLEPNMDSWIGFGELCQGPQQSQGNHGYEGSDLSASAEQILESFYRASGQLKVRGMGTNSKA